MKNDKIIITLFLTIIFGVLISYPIKFIMIKKGITTLQYDNFKIYEEKEFKIFSNARNKIERLKLNVQNRANNYFPFYSEINYGLANTHYFINRNLYGLFNYENIPISSTSYNDFTYKSKKRLYNQSALSSDLLEKKYEEQIEMYNAMYKDDVNMYVYFPNRYEFSKSVDSKLSIRNMNNYIERFRLDINKNIKVGALPYDENYFYKTDHHWNGRGAGNGYFQLAEMMNLNPQNINITTYNIDYMGSLAKQSRNTDIKDKFYGIENDLKYKVLVDGKEAPKEFKPKKIKKSKNQFYDYYVSFFNGQYNQVLYDFNNPYKENLLIIGDSFVWQIDDLLASHFNKTYVVNIRYSNEAFDYHKFIKENNIKNVLILNETQTTLFDNYNYDMKGKIVWNSQT